VEKFLQRKITRREFIKGTGATFGALGLSTVTGGIPGCIRPDPVPALLNGAELVGRVTANAATIRLVGGDLCAPATEFRLLYDTVRRNNAGDYAFSEPARSGFEAHSPINFELSSLVPGARYYYRLGTNEGNGWTYRNECSFVTRRPAGTGFRFCIGTDAHMYPYKFPDSSRRAVYFNIFNDRPDLLITLGDEIHLMQQGRTAYTWSDPADIWNTTKKFRGVLDYAGKSMSCLPVNGNHEGLYGWMADRPEYREILDAKIAYFPVPDETTYPGGGDPLGRYGAFTWGDALFIWLDVVGFCTQDPWVVPEDNGKYILGNEQAAFLQNTLEANAEVPWKFIFSHHLFGGVDACGPGYGRGNAHGANLHDQGLIHDLMQTYGVQAFFYGHDHVFSVSEADRTSYICAGNAGTGCLWVEELDACYQPYEAFAVDPYRAAISGHVRVDVGADTTTISYVKQNWDVDNATVVYSHVIHR
jgi:hypothetical protein